MRRTTRHPESLTRVSGAEAGRRCAVALDSHPFAKKRGDETPP
jgi:hypothetical protein